VIPNIDPVKEIHNMLYGDMYNPPQGHWVVFRRFTIGTYSKYWDSKMETSIGGPKWVYNDYIIRVSFDESRKYDQTSGVGEIPGYIREEERTYIMERCMKPQFGDIIFEYPCIETDDHDVFMEQAKIHVPQKYNIEHVYPVKVDNSTLAYYLFYTKNRQDRV